MRPRLYPRRWLYTLLLLSLSTRLFAQEPYRVEFACSEEDLQAAGMSCDEKDPCPIYLELSGIVRDGQKMFAAGNLHSSSGTMSSVLLLSEDSGATWKEPTPRIRGAALDQLQFYNLQDGWAVGETQYPLARDPFILVTNDGGASWHQVAIGEEGMPGAIQRFYFDSSQHGELIIDAGKSSAAGRYLSYETETGGSSWTLRGKSDQLPRLRLAPASAENADLRIRASKDGKSYVIEERRAGKYSDVTSLAIEVAKCSGKTEELKEPEPDQPPAPPPPPRPAASSKKTGKK